MRMHLRFSRLTLTFTLSADVINVSGHRLGSAEIESALVAHPSVAEAAVIGYPHDIKGCVATAV
jgi:acyl-coenzyme A synthetase/AMP-(fatty) acid ligase